MRDITRTYVSFFDAARSPAGRIFLQGRDLTKVKIKAMDSFWNSDLDVIESTFLGNRKVTDLAVGLDKRVPPQGRVELHRSVNVDNAVSRLLAEKVKTTDQRSTFTKLFDRIIFG
jgi:hypothetical protein